MKVRVPDIAELIEHRLPSNDRLCGRRAVCIALDRLHRVEVHAGPGACAARGRWRWSLLGGRAVDDVEDLRSSGRRRSDDLLREQRFSSSARRCIVSGISPNSLFREARCPPGRRRSSSPVNSFSRNGLPRVDRNIDLGRGLELETHRPLDLRDSVVDVMGVPSRAGRGMRILRARQTPCDRARHQRRRRRAVDEARGHGARHATVRPVATATARATSWPRTTIPSSAS